MSEKDRLLKEISDKLDLLIRLVAADIVRSASVEQERIKILSSSGFRPIEIAKFLNKDPNNINVQLNRIRKKTASDAKPIEKAQDPKSKSEQKAGTVINSSENKGAK